MPPAGVARFEEIRACISTLSESLRGNNVKNKKEHIIHKKPEAEACSSANPHLRQTTNNRIWTSNVSHVQCFISDSLTECMFTFSCFVFPPPSQLSANCSPWRSSAGNLLGHYWQNGGLLLHWSPPSEMTQPGLTCTCNTTPRPSDRRASVRSWETSNYFLIETYIAPSLSMTHSLNAW